MQIKIAARLYPFSHTPGASALMPGTFWKIEAFPTRLIFTHLHTGKTKTFPLEIKGPVQNFTLEQDLEKGHLRIFGKGGQGYFCVLVKLGKGERDARRNPGPSGSGKTSYLSGSSILAVGESPSLEEGVLQIEMHFEKIPGDKSSISLEGDIPPSPSPERLSLGVHKAQDCEAILRRLDLKEIFPFWLRLANWVPPLALETRSLGVLRLLRRCEELIREEKKEGIVPLLKNVARVGFRSVFLPRLNDDLHQGILEEERIPPDLSPLQLLVRGGSLIRSLLIQERGERVFLLPCLPPDFFSGRLLSSRLQNGDLVDLEWSKKLLRRLIIHPSQTRELALALPKPLARFRLRKSEKERGKIIQRGETILLQAGESVLLDRFER